MRRAKWGLSWRQHLSFGSRDGHLMKAYIFFSVHEKLFDAVAAELDARWGVSEFSGFVWGAHQRQWLSSRPRRYSPLHVFSETLLQSAKTGRADLKLLSEREAEYGISLHRMVFSERHLLARMDHSQILALMTAAIRMLDAHFSRNRPDFVFTEDVSCLLSYLHFAEARRHGIPYWIAGSARLPNRLSLYSSGLQHWERTNRRFDELRAKGLTTQQRANAQLYVDEFRRHPKRPTGMETRARRPRLEWTDLKRLGAMYSTYRSDPGNPTSTPATVAIGQRIRRVGRQALAEAAGIFEHPDPNERFVLYPIHFQPEASTLVQAPYYLDQVSLIEDIAKSLPIGHRLYVKEHLSNRGRRSTEFYRRIKNIFSVRLLGPDEDTWSLMERASAVAVITGTMGWEGLLFGKPVVSFGDVFYNVLPQVVQASALPKDRWNEAFRQAIFENRRDDDALLAYLTALRETSFPGFMKNPNTFPAVLEPANVAAIADAIGHCIRDTGHESSSTADGDGASAGGRVEPARQEKVTTFEESE